MRKHFLILMLMALLPLAGWAADDPIVGQDITGYQAVLTLDADETTGAIEPFVYDATNKIPQIAKITLVKTGAAPIDNIGFNRVTLSNWKDANGNAVNEIKNAGRYTCTVTISETSGGPITGVVEVEKKMVTIQAKAKAITYLDPVPTNADFEVVDYLSQFVDADKVDTDDDDQLDALAPGVMSGDITFTTNYKAGNGATDVDENVTYYIRPVVDALTSANYRFGYTDGVLTVGAMSIVATGDDVEENTPATGFTFTVTDPEYNGSDANAKPVVMLNGNALTPADEDGNNDYTISYYLPSETDEDEPAANEAAEGSYTDAGKYFVKVTGQGNFKGELYKEFNVTKKAVVITTKNGSKPYDGTRTTFTTAEYVVFNNLLSVDKGADGTPIATTDRNAYLEGKSIDDIKVKAQFGGVDNIAKDYKENGYDVVAYSETAEDQIFKNYKVVYFNGGKFTVNKKTLTFTARNQSKTQGATHALEATNGVTPTSANASTYLTIEGLIDAVEYSAPVAAVEPVPGNQNQQDVVETPAQPAVDGTKDEIKTYPTLKVTIDATKKELDEATGLYYYPITVDTKDVKITNTFTYYTGVGQNPTATLTDANAASNYEIKGVVGKFSIAAGTIQVMVKPVTRTYGDETKVVYELFMNGASDTDKDAITNAIKADADAIEVADVAQDEETEFPNVGVYDLKLTVSEDIQNKYTGLYNFDVIPSTYEILPAPLKITLKAQALNEGDDASALVANENTVEFTGLKLNDNEKVADLYGNIKFAFSTVLNNVLDNGKLKEYVPATDFEEEVPGSASDTPYEGAITLDAVNTKFANYKYTLADDVTPGDLYVSAVANIVLNLNYADAATWNALEEDVQTHNSDAIKAANNFKNNVGFDNFKLKAEKWYPMVLPFATTVAELSEKFGYAVVNILNTENTDDAIRFKLHMQKIEANQPFLIKIASDKVMGDADETAEEGEVWFKGKTIVDKNNNADVNENTGIQFIGFYDAKIGVTAHDFWFSHLEGWDARYGGTASATRYLRPLNAFVQTPATSTAKVIYVEDPYAGVTAIESISTEGAEAIPVQGWYTVNGIKLEGVPTEKGIYINNGKKVVIK